MADHPSKTRWEAENVIKVGLKINRNQDPELFELLTKAENKAGVIRELLRAGLTTLQQKKNINEASYPQPQWVAGWDYPSSNYNK